MKLAYRISRIKTSATLAAAAKAAAARQQGQDIIDFGLGEPDCPSPDVAILAAQAAMYEGYTKYTHASGSLEIREAIAKKLKEENNLDYTPSDIIVSCGAKHSLYNIAQVLLEHGDEVVIPAPYWTSYPDQVALCEATPVIVATDETNQFLVTPEQLNAAITPRTKAVIINSPSNPTGATYSQKQLEALADVLLSTPAWIISDEIYEHFHYTTQPPVSIAALDPRLKAKTLVVNGVSKSYAMTGWRIGYAAGPREIITAMGTLQSQSTSNPTSIAQRAAIAALQEGKAFIKQMVEVFSERRLFAIERLGRISGFRCMPPAGSFYLFPNVMALCGKRYGQYAINSAVELAEFLLDEAGVAVIPGEAFGVGGYVRLSYAVSMDRLAAGLDRIEKAVSKLL